MDELLAGLRAVAETTRLRLLFILSYGEFNVSELTQILGQSQPRISRHLKLMADAGLVDRHKEGSWMLIRLRNEGASGALPRLVAALLPAGDPILAGDAQRMADIRRQRADRAAAYFRNNAANWEQLRSFYVREENVEATMLRLACPGKLGLHLDLGTGTGRMLHLFSSRSAQAIGVDSSREMLAIARSNLEHAGLRHIQVRHGDIYVLPFSNSCADFITLHQVLHYLDEPARALAEAARVLKPGGQLLIVDFAPHEIEQLREEHAHRRLGLAPDQMAQWLVRCGLSLVRHELLPPPADKGVTGLTVSIWLAQAPARSLAGPQQSAAVEEEVT